MRFAELRLPAERGGDAAALSVTLLDGLSVRGADAAGVVALVPALQGRT